MLPRLSGSVAAITTRGSLIRLGSEASGRALSLVATLLIARGLGPESYGPFGVLTGIALLLAEVADLGLAGTAARNLSNRSWSLGDFLLTKLWLSLVTLALAGTIFLGLGSHLFGIGLAGLILYVLGSSWVEALGIALRCGGSPLAEAAVVLCLRASILALVALAFVERPALLVFVGALMLSPLLAGGLGLGLLWRRRGAFSSASAQGPHSALRESLPVGLFTALSLIAFRVELLLLLPLKGEVATGLFAGALRLVDGVKLVPVAICQGAMPFLAVEGAVEEGEARNQTSSSVLLLAVPCSIGLFLLAPGLLDLLLGRAFAEAAGPLRVLALALTPAFLNSFLVHVLLSAGRLSDLPRLMAARLAAALALGLVLIPLFGSIGAAWTYLLAEILELLLALRAASAAQLLLPLLAPLRLALLASAPMALIVGLAPVGPLLAVALGAATFLAAVALTRRFA